MNTSVLLEFAMFPTSAECREGASVSEYVSRIVDVIDKSGVAYQLTPMGTIIECSSMREALDVIEKAYTCLSECERVYSSLKFDIRHGKSDRLKTKIDSVQNKLGREVKH